MSETTSVSNLEVGQYCYNLETYPGVITNIVLFSMDSAGKWQSVDLVNGQIWHKVGIQAPMGTQVVIDEKVIMIGRSGIYELDDGITIESLKFIPPVKYNYNEDESKAAMEAGMTLMNDSKSALDTIYKNAGDNALTEEQLNAANAAALAYNEGYKKYMEGKIGIYTEGDMIDLKNVIIDFVYSETNTVVEGE